MLTHPNVKARIADLEREIAQVTAVSEGRKVELIRLGDECRAEWKRAEAAEAKVQEQAAEIERLRDLVRYERHALHNSGLISNEEFADLVQVQGAVARLEGYDVCRQRAEAAEQRAAELAGKLAEAQKTLRIQRAAWDGVIKIEVDGELVDFAEAQIKRIDAALKSQEPQEKQP
jgi:hypothetical protein